MRGRRVYDMITWTNRDKEGVRERCADHGNGRAWTTIVLYGEE